MGVTPAPRRLMLLRILTPLTVRGTHRLLCYLVQILYPTSQVAKPSAEFHIYPIIIMSRYSRRQNNFENVILIKD